MSSSVVPLVQSRGQFLRSFTFSAERKPFREFSPWVGFLGVTGTGLACFAAFLHYELGDDENSTEGLRRAAYFYSYAIPKYIQYRYYLYTGKSNEEWNELHQNTSLVALSMMKELAGFYIKCGQMIAANIGDAFPRVWQNTMSVLQDNCPHQDFQTVQAILKNDGIDMDEVFVDFEPVPIGAASIGQVHRAILREGNRPVVVKICYPHVERLLRGDVRTVKNFAKLAQPVHVPALDEIEKQFQNEFDYREEARHLQTVHDNVRRVRGFENFRVPVPYSKYCTKHVLVMEELPGQKLVEALRSDMEKISKFQSSKCGSSTIVAKMKQRWDKAEMAGENFVGPSEKEFNDFRRLLRTKYLWESFLNFCTNWTIGWIVPSVVKPIDRRSQASVHNHAALVNKLILIHGHEVLVHGYFNGDCHPGNFLLDENGKVGLIDYGQIKELNKEERHLFARIVIALAEDNRSEVIRLMKLAGFRSEKMDPEVIYLYAKVGYDEDNRELTGGKHIQMFMEELQGRDPIRSLPEAYIMVSRASLMLRGLAHALHQPRSVAKLWKPIAERVIKENL